MSTSTSSPYSNDEYTIGWIAALSEELSVAMAMLDEEHGKPQTTPQDDTNAYHLGKIGQHHIVMACLPGGQMGTGPAALVAENMRRTFKNVRFALLVGIGAGVPNRNSDIRLGDVVVSYPYKTYTGVVQYDYGKLNSDNNIERKDWFCPPPRKLLATVDLLRAYHQRPRNPKNNMLPIIDELGDEYAYPEEEQAPDRLYQASYSHVTGAETCHGCDEDHVIVRRARKLPNRPQVHYGIIASGNMVLKNGVERDKINQRYENAILCFEMEAAGLMNNFPCLVIRGICDYADSHKSDSWRKRAMAAASAYAKELLSLIEPCEVQGLTPIAAQVVDSVSRIDTNTKELRIRQREDMLLQCEAWLKPLNARAIHQDLLTRKFPQTCEWIWTNKYTPFFEWFHSPLPSVRDRIMCIYGSPGCGKSILASSMVHHLWNKNIPALFFAFSGIDASQHHQSGFVRSLLWQLLDMAPTEPAIHIIRQLMIKGQPVTSELWMAFDKVAALVRDPVCCIVDGIDECKDIIQDLFLQLDSFLGAHANFRFVLLGRQHAFQSVDSFITHRLKLSPDLTEQDISKVIANGIAKSEVLTQADLQSSVHGMLRRQSDGNFLWVHLMLKELKRSFSVADVDARLCNLPRDLEAAYRDLLFKLADRLDQKELDFARKVLQIIIVSQRPLSLTEFQHLLAAEALSTTCTASRPFEDHLIQQPERQILDICGDFVSIVDGHLRLVHFSMHEFLVRPENKWSKCREVMVFRVVPEDAHCWLGAACIKYLQVRDYGSPFHDWNVCPEMPKCHPFLGYSSRYVVTHLYRSGSPSTYILDNIGAFLDSARLLSWIEILAMNIVEDESLHFHIGELQKLVSWLGEERCSEKLALHEIPARLESELKKQIQHSGQNDARTELLRLFLEYIKGMTTSTDTQVGSDFLVQSAAGSTDISPIIRALQNKAPLSIQFQVNMLLKLQLHLRKAKQLTDPLHVLFRIVLQHASAMPVYVLFLVGAFYRRVRKFELALEVYCAALRKFKKKEVQLKFLTLHFIGITYFDLSQYEQALESHKTALAGQEGLLGQEHEDTLSTLNQIGRTYTRLKQYEKALQFYTRAFIGREKVLGLEHENTLYTIHWIGDAYYNLKQFDKALEFFTRSFIGLEKALGPEHENTLNVIYWIGDTYNKLKQYEKALEFFTRAFTGRDKTLGPEHENTLNAICAAGEMHNNLEQYEMALELYTRALAGWKKILGSEHEYTLNVIQSTGNIYYNLREYEKALSFYTTAFKGRSQLLGPEHEDTLHTFYCINDIFTFYG